MKQNELERLYVLSLFNAERLTDSVRVRLEDMDDLALRAIVDAIYVSDEAHGLHDPSTVLAQMYAEKSKNAADLERMLENFEPVYEAPLRAQMVRVAALHRTYRTLVREAAQAFERDDTEQGISLTEKIAALQPDWKDKFHTVSIADTIDAARKDLANRMNGKCSRIRLGLGLFDKEIGALLPGSMTTIGGRTSDGKSSLALRLALNMAAAGKRVAILALEDPETIWGSRALAAIGGISLEWISTGAGYGQEAAEDFARLADIARNVAGRYEIQITVAIGATGKEAVAEADKLVRKHAPDVLFVDYLQAPVFGATADRRLAIGDFASKLKGICHRAQIPLIVLSQLKRSPGREYSEPAMSELKEAGEIENSSEVVMILWRDNDRKDAVTHGKLPKIKWGRAGKRFSLQRSTVHQMVTGVADE